jgi:hypothetical protein
MGGNTRGAALVGGPVPQACRGVHKQIIASGGPVNTQGKLPNRPNTPRLAVAPIPVRVKESPGHAPSTVGSLGGRRRKPALLVRFSPMPRLARRKSATPWLPAAAGLPLRGGARRRWLACTPCIPGGLRITNIRKRCLRRPKHPPHLAVLKPVFVRNASAFRNAAFVSLVDQEIVYHYMRALAPPSSASFALLLRCSRIRFANSGRTNTCLIPVL